MHLSVIIPAYNEAKRIPATLQSIHQYLSKQSYEYEILVVSDGSTDDTARVVENAKSQIPNLKLLDNKENHGKAYVVKQGMLAATGELRLFMDADNSTTIEVLDSMMPFLKAYEVIIASLGVAGSKKVGHEPSYRRWLGKAGNLWIQFWATPGIHDTQRGFKLFTAEAANKIFPKMKTFGWGFDVEVLALAHKFGFKIKEVPITWNNDPNSKVNIWAYPKVLMQTLVIRWYLLTNQYGI